ncbi:ABC-2 family transporter protein [Allokutzneria multivorans]|uniref:ABC-2 family transporter protein n=1 Tax=Allokutzneria multivorans TaxID=1142134 RepID=A0ABP7R4A7_9PSEU
MADRVYLSILGSRFRSQLSYRTSFLLDFVAQMLGQAGELIVILVLFGRATELGGFAVHEVLIMYGIAGVGFGLADLFVGQLDELPRLIRTGQLDVLLLRPLSTLAQVVTGDIQLRRVGRIAAALGVLVYVLSTSDIAWSAPKLLLAITAPLVGAVLFGSIWVVACSICFWIVDGRELANAVTYGSNMFSSYPITVYPPWLRRVLAFVIPGAFIAYYPALALLDRPDPLGAPAFLGWCSPLIALVAAGVAGLVWRFAVRHYQGTGS